MRFPPVLFFSFISLFFSSICYSQVNELNWVGCGISKKAYMSELAKAYEQYANVKINIQGGGATRGIRDVNAGQADLGGSCRYFLLDNAQEQGIGLEPVAWDALVVIVNKNNPVKDITFDQIHDLYIGKIANWKQLGGNDKPIQLLSRQGKHSGVGHTIRKLIYSDDKIEFASYKQYKSSGPLEKAVVENENAIAITGVSSARLRDVKILTLNGKTPDYRTIKSGRYQLYRPLYITYNSASPNYNDVKDFIAFAHSKTGRDIMKANNVVPYLEALPLVMKQVEQDLKAQKNSVKDVTY